MKITDDRILVFRDDRIRISGKHVYAYLKEDNRDLIVNNTNKVYLFYKIFNTDKEALAELNLYENILENIKQISTLNDITQLLLIDNIPTLIKLSSLISTGYYETLDNELLTNDFLLIKDIKVKIKKQDDGYNVKAEGLDININPIITVKEQNLNKRCVNTNYLFINNLPDGLSLIKDTNPLRNGINDRI